MFISGLLIFEMAAFGEPIYGPVNTYVLDDHNTCGLVYDSVYSGTIENIQYTLTFNTDHLSTCQGTAVLQWSEMIIIDGLEWYRPQQLSWVYVADTEDRVVQLFYQNRLEAVLFVFRYSVVVIPENLPTLNLKAQ
jgi:hypothetical protein